MAASIHTALNTSDNSSSEVTPQTQTINFFLNTMDVYWSFVASTPAALSILFLGLIANTINLIVFYKTGIKDNVTTLLFSLSISDTVFLSLSSPNACYWLIYIYTLTDETFRGDGNYNWPFHRRFVSALFYWPAYTAFDLSCFISLSLGVMRCACVAMPLKFKLVFTKSRTLKWVAFLVVFAVALRIPVLSLYRIVVKTDPLTNTTKPYLEIAKNSRFVYRINDILNRGVVTWINYFVMVVCVCLLTFKLYQASKIRRSVTNKNSSEQGISAKDAQVVMSVVLVCSIFIISQLPLFILSQLRLLDADFADGGKYEALFGIVARLGFTCSVLNASVNIFVYYNFNSKYRAVFLSLFHSPNQEKA